ncbi:MAG: hypothetical protein H0U79_06270 [Solirubrobacterales bacterium]|nr:hypothetical protein [Solirubrobacterales bacterium]
MYRFSRAIYRELARDIRPVGHEDARSAHAQVLRACEQAVERLANDRHYFRRPARTLFNDIRAHFPVVAQERVWNAVSAYLACAEQWLAEQPARGVDGLSRQCRAMTRRGTACQRLPLAHNGYCPSHQHLADTEDAELHDPMAA